MAKDVAVLHNMNNMNCFVSFKTDVLVEYFYMYKNAKHCIGRFSHLPKEGAFLPGDAAVHVGGRLAHSKSEYITQRHPIDEKQPSFGRDRAPLPLGVAQRRYEFTRH
jgi:hypothetical protein